MVKKMRLIDADAAIEVVHKWLEDVFRISSTADEVTVFKRLRALPTVDAVPVRHGRWVKGGMASDSWEFCFICRFPKAVRRAQWYYCPSCGAKMDKGD